jgi:putative endonuclease
MFTVYVIRSSRGIRYIGYTRDLVKRLEQHNSGISKFTSRDSHWRLIYRESYPTRAKAINRERWLKGGEGRRFLDAIEKTMQLGL